MSGYDFAAEAHFVHVNENDPNDLKVVGVFLQLQAEIVFQVRTHVKTQCFAALLTPSSEHSIRVHAHSRSTSARLSKSNWL
jgi:hypothetical protein